jgi:hypothetical protein
MLRDIGRRYSDLNARVFAKTQMAMGDMAGAARGTGEGTDNDPVGERYAALDQLARDSGSKQRLAMRKLVLTENPDENPLWLNRLIAEASYGRCNFESIAPFERDRMILEQAKQALVAMVEGR